MMAKSAKKAPEDKRVTVSIRNVSQTRWKTVQALADKQGLKMKFVLDQMFDDWIKANER